MSDNWRKVLTEQLLGECWHDWHRSAGFGNWLCHTCRKEVMIQIPNRTFITWQDVGDVKEKLVEMGRWERFFRYASLKCPYTNFDQVRDDVVAYITAWLFRPINEQGEPHFCKLCYDAGVELGWWKEQ